jgi:16S rRNA C967 or C1407 C5-methylase (RsmB/RsmF family)
MEKLALDFVSDLKKIYSEEEINTIQDWFKTEEKKVTFRVNFLRSTEDEVESLLTEHEINFSKLWYLKWSYVLDTAQESDLWELDMYKEWKIYLQSTSSQLPVHFFDFVEWDKILDLAAAPWGKTSQIASHLWSAWNIIAVDNNQIRVDKLNFTLRRQGAKSTIIIKKDARNLTKELQYLNIVDEDDIEHWYFDAILFDAPCSSEGRINLSQEKTYDFLESPKNKQFYKLQRDILKNNISLLKNWWQLIYSTCTISPLENEAIVHFLLSNFPELEIVDLDEWVFWDLHTKNWITHFWDIAYRKDVSKSKRILPQISTEGFFIAKFRKRL